jgi:hypothetical protein
MRILVAGAAAAIGGCATVAEPAADAAPLAYRILLSEAAPLVAEVELDKPPARLLPARDGNAAPITGLSCDGRPLAITGNLLEVPQGCGTLRWSVRLIDLDAQGVDASVPPSGWSPQHRFWYLAERHGLLRPADLRRGGEVTVVTRWSEGSVAARTLRYPTLEEPPFYAVAGRAPSHAYEADGVHMSVWGSPPDFTWMTDIHRHVLRAWARWRRDVVAPGATSPAGLDFAWLKPRPDMEPGYNASAGAHAIGAQLRLREGDPDAQSKARAVIGSSAAHEGFHSIIGTTGQGWPTWVNESLANYFALEAARGFLAAADFAFLERIYSDAEVTTPLLTAQADHDRGRQDEGRDVFYRRGPRFWREIQAVLTSRRNGSGRLAALIQDSDGFRGINLSDANAVGRFLDRHSAGRAGPIVRCHLLGAGCGH